MVRPFLQGNRQKRAVLLQILEHDYSEWHTRISEQQRQTLPDWAVKAFEEQGKKDAEASRKEFWGTY